jgi:hypothetical protein
MADLTAKIRELTKCALRFAGEMLLVCETSAHAEPRAPKGAVRQVTPDPIGDGRQLAAGRPQMIQPGATP